MAELKKTADIDRRQLLKLGAGAAVVAGLGVAGVLALGQKPAKELVSHYRSGDIPGLDPLNSLWGKIAPRILDLAPQQMSAPILKAASIKNLQVRSMNNGREIAFHLEWEDQEGSGAETIDRFRDAVAIQLPLKEGPVPPVTMGSPESPVYLLHWKASWQVDVDKGKVQGAAENYPHLFQDVVPDQVFDQEKARIFYPALAAGNAYAQPERKSPVEEIVSRGFGTVTTLSGGKAAGKGVFAKGRWKVAMVIPMEGGPDRPAIKPGAVQQVALAAWNGGDKNVGGRKHFAGWQPVEVKGAGA